MAGLTVKVSRLLVAALCVSCFTLLCLWNYTELIEAFGPGEPYRSRTENMDKWQNPIPTLAVVDATVLMGLAITVRWLIKRPKERA